MTDPTTGELKGFAGDILVPSFDKLILSMSPTAAVQTLTYHLTEMHVETNNPNEGILTSVAVNKMKQLQRISNSTINLFNRAFIRPQLQTEAGRSFRLTTDERASIQHWMITSEDNSKSVLSTVTTELSWSNNFPWSYNYAFSTSLISTSLDNHWTCFMPALEYSGSSTMSRINAEEANRLWAQINKPENWRDAQNIPMAGSKTLERLRGNSRVTEWVNAMTHDQLQCLRREVQQVQEQHCLSGHDRRWSQ